jgi:hypothetical protein
MKSFFAEMKMSSIFALSTKKIRAISSAGSEHLPYKQRVGGSNPSSPTTQKPILRKQGRFCL